MTTVSIKQDAVSAALTIDATLGGTTLRLIPDVDVKFAVENGTRYLFLEAISASTGNTKFKLTFKNAQRWNGNRYVEDAGYDGYRKRLRVYVPGVAS